MSLDLSSNRLGVGRRVNFGRRVGGGAEEVIDRVENGLEALP